MVKKILGQMVKKILGQMYQVKNYPEKLLNDNVTYKQRDGSTDPSLDEQMLALKHVLE